MHNLLPKDGEVYFYPELFTAPESDYFFDILSKEIAWKQEPVFIMGRNILQPRLTAWYGDPDKPYSYSGITMQPHPWTPALMEIKSRIEAVAGVRFTSALLNFYRDGQDSMGWHRDNEKELGINPVIGSVSFGSPRTFALKHYTDKTLTEKIPLTHGSFLLMKGSTQHHWLHSIPKQLKVTAGRINLTFRIIL
ncbi:Alkylated DNA repair dioxygenase AlkB [Chitinophaga sp. YR573]|uniref:alpha-ketoglutarate-dependent dioxygenase AlkB family protein n=1 Tax=Chitinophaga sp. YR573 TaxID=1881040 RepID=UPI0008B50F99|nr:alpha-ketoglutarate-dependent dioxygenase AlkB [Chitinophaga sp. YR573]SEW45239.1 Alkylated DNA repair dioxygenase AlkB [Chitinophaga sp. YR573]